MKKLFIGFLTTCMLIVPTTLASASEVKMDKDIITTSSSTAGVIVDYKTLKVGYSLFLIGDSMQVMSGADCISTFGMRVTAEKPGNAVIYLYKAGQLIARLYLTVTY